MTPIRKALSGLKETLCQIESYIRELYEGFALGEMDKAAYLAAKSTAAQKREETAARMQELQAELENTGVDGKLNNRFVNCFQKYTEVEEITAEYGSGCDMGRKGLDKVYNAAEHGEMDCVLVASRTRLGRVILDTTEYVRQLKECGVQVICADSMTIDDHTGILLRELVQEAKACNYCGNA